MTIIDSSLLPSFCTYLGGNQQTMIAAAQKPKDFRNMEDLRGHEPNVDAEHDGNADRSNRNNNNLNNDNIINNENNQNANNVEIDLDNNNNVINDNNNNINNGDRNDQAASNNNIDDGIANDNNNERANQRNDGGDRDANADVMIFDEVNAVAERSSRESDENVENSVPNPDDHENGRSNNANNSTASCNSTVMTAGVNGRKSKRRRRHFNLAKNKKWNKQFKRQKNGQTNVKSDMENIQTNRNKHTYGGSKLPKIIFNNKTLLHRGGISKFFLPDKRPRKDVIIPPTKFLLGGNISDPLNLNSLQDEALASMNAVTPKSSPITTPPKVEVIIPPNICDPLHLLDPVDSIEYEKQLISPMKRRVNKHRNRKKRLRRPLDSSDTSITSTGTGDATNGVTDTNTNNAQSVLAAENPEKVGEAESMVQTGENGSEVVPRTGLDLLIRDPYLDLSAMARTTSNIPMGRKRKSSECTVTSNVNTGVGNGSATKTKLRRMDSMDKIVSPVIPQPGGWKRPPKVLPMGARNRSRTASSSMGDDLISPSDEFGGLKKTLELMDDERNEVDVEQAEIPSQECSTEPALPNFQCDIPGVCKALTPSNAGCNSANATDAAKVEAKQEPKTKYQYGNYTSRYLGVQNLNHFSDVRLTVFMRYPYLFRDKDILDIGCNVGHMTFAVARKLHPKSIHGIDIDSNLISRARRNLSLFVRIPNHVNDDTLARASASKLNESSEDSNMPPQDAQKANKRRARSHRSGDRADGERMDFFPVSFPICYQGLYDNNYLTQNSGAATAITPSRASLFAASSTLPSASATDTQNVAAYSENKFNPNPKMTHIADDGQPIQQQEQQPEPKKPGTVDVDQDHLFPRNVFFRTLNYAVTDESQLSADNGGQQYDLILCLSVTKWIHLNYGDAGLKLTFRRIFNNLRPGGKLILEAQNWASYKKRKKLTENIYNNYRNIEFFPKDFHVFLLSPEVGFSHSYALGLPRHASKGFYRPIQLYVKGDFTPSQVRWSDSYHPQTPYEPYRYGYYTDTSRIAHRKGSLWGHHNVASRYSGIYSSREASYSSRVNRFNTPSHCVSASTSQYYNPLETDSYLPSYDNEVQTRHYCFASPLYSTVWSPPTSGRKSASQTPLFGSIRRVNDADDNYNANRRHVYPPTGPFDGGSGSSRSVDDTNYTSPQVNHVYAIGSSRSVREIDIDTNANSPKEYVYATSAAPCCENSSSPHSGESSRSIEQDDQIISDD